MKAEMTEARAFALASAASTSPVCLVELLHGLAETKNTTQREAITRAAVRAIYLNIPFVCISPRSFDSGVWTRSIL